MPGRKKFILGLMIDVTPVYPVLASLLVDLEVQGHFLCVHDGQASFGQAMLSADSFCYISDYSSGYFSV